MATSETGKSRKPGTFTKGDARINRKGRPRSFDKLRALAQSISHEPALNAEGEVIVAEDGHIVTVVEMVLRSMMHDRKQRRQFIEIAFGKVPDELNVHGGADDTIQVRLVDYRKGLVDDKENEGPVEE